ncbi:MarR family winged helix-turn-helix transcriptional regulator [Ornithinicoccus halotolerans]|uniref:MarR family winged helix-turn-helix transcriptional regulator n=1 Tax=Ornithinicoccus halotolerans TaxID=1748220 RepID=UPI001E5487B1|nr:MarR family winged helix-turn-helix transcriptional regulator [Ornithinicoccus halotolerans]
MTAAADPTTSSTLRPLKQLLDHMEEELSSLYDERGITAVRPRFSMVLIRLAHQGPMTVRQLAEATGRTHSAASQTVAAMRREGLVTSAPGDDARTRRVVLTGAGRELVPWLEDEWRATEAAWEELEREVPYPLSQVVRDLQQALARRGFRDRVDAHLAPSRGQQ